MTPAHVLTFDRDVPAAALDLLAAEGPALLIDVAGGRLLAANAAGSALLGLDPTVARPVLDASMPALTRLRDLARQADRADTALERLVFWGRNSTVAVRFRVQFLGTWPQALVVVAHDEAEAAQGPTKPSTKSDAVRLKEIARQIRQGQMTRLQPARTEPQAARTSVPDPPPGPGVSATFSVRANLAHELKTPVSAIAAAAEIMRDARFGALGNPRYAGYARDIHGSALHVLGVIDRMLAEERADAAQPDLDVTEIDVGAMLADVTSQLAPLAERAGHDLALDLPSRLPHVIADATSLRQILFNLATNAFKFTDRGGRITLAARYDRDGALAIALSDTGPGMDDAEIQRLLASDAPERMPQRDGTSPGEYERVGLGPGLGPGLGLGLPLVRALAAANGANLSIESAPGNGTTVSVVFGKQRVVPV